MNNLARAAMLASIAPAALWAMSHEAAGQSQVLPCYRPNTGIGCVAVSPALPLPVTGTFTPGGTQDVNISQVGGAATVAGTVGAVFLLANTATVGSVIISGTPTVINGAGTATIGSVVISGTPTVINGAGSATIGSVIISGTPSLGAGSATIGSVVISGTPSLGTGSATIGGVFLTPAAAGGLSTHSAVLTAGTNATNVKASAGQLYNINVGNNSAGLGYLKFYNSAGTPTCNSDTVVAEFIIPASTSGAGSNISFNAGLQFTTGLAYCVTAGIAVNDNTTVAATSFIVQLGYK